MKTRGEGFYVYGYLCIFLLMTLGAFVWQTFIPSIADTYSLWNGSRGWQTEIALWNLGIDAGILWTLGKRNIEYGKILVLVSFVLSVLLGGHHLVYALSKADGNKTLHWLGAVEVLGFGGGLGMLALIKGHVVGKR